MKDRLIIALDLSDEDRFNQVLKDLRGSIDWVKWEWRSFTVLARLLCKGLKTMATGYF